MKILCVILMIEVYAEMSQSFQLFSPEIDKFLNENTMRDFLIGVYY
jgi:hypothetical protein